MLTDTQLKWSANIVKLQNYIAGLHYVVTEAVRSNRSKSSGTISNGDLPNFVDADYVLVSRDNFQAEQKLIFVMRW